MHTQDVLEQAMLPVRKGREEEFIAAFAEAKTIIASMPGFQGVSLSRRIERPNEFLLLVSWRNLEDHTVGFRESEQYGAWKALLHHFYDPFPQVDHFLPVDGVEGSPS